MLSSCKGEGTRKKATSLQNGGPPHSKTVDPKIKKPVVIISVKVKLDRSTSVWSRSKKIKQLLKEYLRKYTLKMH